MSENSPTLGDGRAVLLTEVVPFAKPGHATCHGLGYIVRVVKGQRIPWPCACAGKRFARAHGRQTYDRGGTLFWLPQHVPATTVVLEPEEQTQAA